MADSPSKPTKKRRIKPVETVRERNQKVSTAPPKAPRRVSGVARRVTQPIKAAHQFGQKTYFIPMPDNRLGRFLNKRRYWIPKYFRESWRELKEVAWPDRKQTSQLSFAVFVFAIVFGVLVAVTDYGLDRIFKRILLK